MRAPANRLPARLAVVGSYGLGSLGANVAVFPVNTMLLYYLTDTMSVAVSLATLIISAPKIWDILVDPAIGAFADRYARMRKSRFRVFAAVAGLLPILSAMPFLLPHLPGLWLAVAATLLLIGGSATLTTYQITHAATADDLDAAGVASRNAMISTRIIGQAGGALAVGGLAPLLLGGGGSTDHGYGRMVFATAAVSMALLLICTAGLRYIPTAPLAGGRRPSPSLARALGEALARPQAIGLLLSNFGVTMAASYLSNITPYVNKYALHEPDRALSVLFSLPTAAMLGGAALMPLIARRLGNTRSFMLASLGLLFASATFRSVSGNFDALLGASMCWGLAMGGYSVLLQAMMLDASHGDADAGLTGLLLGLLFSTAKVADTLGGTLTGATLSRSADGLRLGIGLVPVLLVGAGSLAMWLVAVRPTRRQGGGSIE